MFGLRANGYFEDPALYIETLFQKRAIVFDWARTSSPDQLSIGPRYTGEEERMLSEARAAFCGHSSEEKAS